METPVSIYDTETGAPSEARWSPLDLQHGRYKPLIPRGFTTQEPPTVPEGQKLTWDGSTWGLDELPPATFIAIETAANLEPTEFAKEVQDEFEAARVTHEEGSVRFDNVPDTEANRTTLTNLISVHNFNASLLERLREERDKRLNCAMWLLERHLKQEKWGGGTTTLTAEQATSLYAYYTALCDLPETCVDPANPTWPTPPEGIANDKGWTGCCS